MVETSEVLHVVLGGVAVAAHHLHPLEGGSLGDLGDEVGDAVLARGAYSLLRRGWPLSQPPIGGFGKPL